MVATLIAVALITAAPADATTPAVESDDTRFPVDMSAAMGRMMVAMDVKPSGDVDADFVAMMIPHHQGAIDMAQAELHYGRNEQLRRLAQEIIVTQQQEIAVMRLAVGQPVPSPVPSANLSSSAKSPDIQHGAHHSMYTSAER